MKHLYLLCITMLLFAVKGITQTSVIPATPTANNMEKMAVAIKTSAIDDSAFGRIHILPNIAVGKITVIVDDANTNVIQQGECIVYNNSGYPVASKPFTTGSNEIFVNTLSTGMYYVRLIQKNGQAAVRKFMVTR